MNLTTGTREIAASATCIGSAANGDPCYCENQVQPNQCADGVCTVDAKGEGTCGAGPIDPLCAIETFRSCTTNSHCPATGDGCTNKTRGCLGATLSRTGTPSAATPLQVATFCINDTRSGAVNTAAGLPGPGSLLLPSTTCVKPTCP